jgi:hypothetical protein
MRTTWSLIVLASVVLLPLTASADMVTFTFNYYTIPPHVAPHTPIPGGPFGTLTLTDSVVDPNRVDIDLTIAPLPAYAAAQLEQFYINFQTPFLTNHQFYLVDQSTAPTGASNDPFPGPDLGTVGYASGVTTFDFADFVFDVRPNPTSGAQTFAGSLSLYNQLPNPDVPVNLDVGMFNLTSGGTNSPPMYAGYRTNNFNVNPNDPNFPDGEFWAFASISTPGTGIPEASQLLMAAVVLVSGAGASLWSRYRRRPTAE